ncbi:hypothetical protein RUND412_002725 [Rhizina undulata]
MPALNISNNSNQDGAHTDNSLMVHLLIALVVLVSFGLILGGSLFFIRRHRKARIASGTLPTYESANTNPPRLAVNTRDSFLNFSEKQTLIGGSSPMCSTPESPVPEIRITFPEEEDTQGRRISGKVVVVQVGEAGVGFVRPLEQDGLPPYQQTNNEEFSSVDIEKIGGLKEKDEKRFG